MRERSLAHETEVGQVVMHPTGVIIQPPEKGSLDHRVTPAASHFVIAHMGVAHVDADDWQLRIGGLVEDAFTLSYREIMESPPAKTTTFLECAGNPLRPDKPIYRVGNAEWSGVPLRALLDRARVRPEGRYVWLKGVDFGEFGGTWSQEYVKDIPLSKAFHDSTLIACRMNNARLTPEHGFPVRAIIPGFYGTNSVKWLSEVTVAADRPDGYYTTELYNYPAPSGRPDVTKPVWNVEVDSIITHPASAGTVSAGRNKIEGWAWGAAEVVRVGVSADGGRTWSEAEVEPRSLDYSWQRFSANWQPTRPGLYTLSSRARDAGGDRQPSGPHINQIYTTVVTVTE